MLERSYESQNCSIASTLEIVGERWTLLMVHDVFLGLHRFDQFQESLGIARNVLTDRLNWLVTRESSSLCAIATSGSAGSTG